MTSLESEILALTSSLVFNVTVQWIVAWVFYGESNEGTTTAPLILKKIGIFVQVAMIAGYLFM